MSQGDGIATSSQTQSALRDATNELERLRTLLEVRNRDVDEVNEQWRRCRDTLDLIAAGNPHARQLAQSALDATNAWELGHHHWVPS